MTTTPDLDKDFGATDEFVLVRRLKTGGVRVIGRVTDIEPGDQDTALSRLLTDGIEKIALAGALRGVQDDEA